MNYALLASLTDSFFTSIFDTGHCLIPIKEKKKTMQKAVMKGGAVRRHRYLRGILSLTATPATQPGQNVSSDMLFFFPSYFKKALQLPDKM